MRDNFFSFDQLCKLFSRKMLTKAPRSAATHWIKRLGTNYFCRLPCPPHLHSDTNNLSGSCNLRAILTNRWIARSSDFIIRSPLLYMSHQNNAPVLYLLHVFKIWTPTALYTWFNPGRRRELGFNPMEPMEGGVELSAQKQRSFLTCYNPYQPFGFVSESVFLMVRLIRAKRKKHSERDLDLS